MYRTFTILFSLIFINGFAQISFEENAYGLGVDETFGPEIFGGGGVTFFDFNSDGLDDISMATTVGDSINFFINMGGYFEKVIPSFVGDTSQVKNILWGDYNNDGNPDLFVTGYHSGFKLYLNLGDLVFEDVTEASGLVSNNESGFQGAAWGDINNDGYLDLYITTNDGSFDPNYLYINNTDGSFENITLEAGVSDSIKSPFGLVFSDLDDDGDQDMYLSIDHNGGNTVFINNGDNTFEDVTTTCGGGLEMYSMCISAGDYDGDGIEDFYFSNMLMPPVGSRLTKGNGDATFTEVSDDAGVNWQNDGWGSSWLDADLDGDLDLFSVSCHDTILGFESCVFYENQGDGTFISLDYCGFEIDNTKNFSCAIGDIENDGYPDIIVNNDEGYPLSIWQNTTINENHFIKIDLEGTESNKDGIGSWIEVYIDGEMQRRYTHNANGYLSQNTSYEIIGLGLSETIDSLKVIWLSGIIDIAYDVMADQRLTIVEGEGATTIDEQQLHSFVLFPNPSSSSISINFSSYFPEIKRIDFYNIEGRLVKSINVSANADHLNLDINDLKEGLYLINIVSENEIFSKRLSVIH